jgi:hypothetical protein
MSESFPREDNSQDALRRILSGVLNRLSAPAAFVLRLSAIPHWFDKTLLRHIAGDSFEYSWEQVDLSQIPFIFPGSLERYRCEQPVREILLEEWRKEQPELFTKYNRSAWEYFASLANQADFLSRPGLQREAIYHQLTFDEPAGLFSLAAAFEDAVDRRQFGSADDLMRTIGELELSARAQNWLRYFSARLVLDSNPEKKNESALIELSSSLPDPFLNRPARSSSGDETQPAIEMDYVLRAILNWSLGKIYLGRSEWSQAIRLFRSSLSLLQDRQVDLYIARVMLALGDAYLDLADRSGFNASESWQSRPPLRHLVYLIQNLPFVIFESLLRRVDFLPSDWYFGTNYQDWIIAFLLVQASRWYRRARRRFVAIEDEPGDIRALLAQAEMELEKGRWSRARHTYLRLQAHPLVRSSAYRTAQVQAGLGRVYLAQGSLSQAAEELDAAARIFQRFRDFRSFASTSERLGIAHSGLGSFDRARDAFRQSLDAYHQLGDLLRETQVIWDLENLGVKVSQPGHAPQGDKPEEASRDERHYLTRFPDSLLRWFRSMALVVAVPLTYLTVILACLGLVQASAVVEMTLRLTFGGNINLGAISFADALTLLMGVILPLPLAFWIYRFIYSLIGMTMVHLLGQRLVRIEREQPDRLITSSEGLIVHRSDDRPDGQTTWVETTAVTSIEYRFWSKPIQLISDLVVSTKTRPIVLSGTTIRYEQLKRDLLNRLPDHVRYKNLDFVFMVNRWGILTLAASLLHAASLVVWVKYADFTGYLQGQEVPLEFSLILLISFLDILLIYPALTLWRVVWHRRQRRRWLGASLAAFPGWILYLAAVLISVLTVAWLLLSLFFRSQG